MLFNKTKFSVLFSCVQIGAALMGSAVIFKDAASIEYRADRCFVQCIARAPATIVVTTEAASGVLAVIL